MDQADLWASRLAAVKRQYALQQQQRQISQSGNLLLFVSCCVFVIVCGLGGCQDRIFVGIGLMVAGFWIWVWCR